jgi:hypothetical protein
VFYFNANNYSSSNKRQFVLGNINYYSAKNTYTIEFASSEIISNNDIELFEKCNKEKLFNGNLYFFVATNKQLSDLSTLQTIIPTKTPSEMYEGLIYQPIVKKETYGMLRKISMDSLKNTILNEHDILLIDGSPLEVAAVAGIITTAFQAPLSHLCILSQNRKTPFCAYKNAWTNTYIDALNNTYVHYTVANNSMYITPSTFAEMQAHKGVERKHINLKPDYTKQQIIPIKNINHNSVSYAGGKAANFGELYRIKNNNSFELPSGAFCIPIYFYKNHTHVNAVDSLITQGLAEIKRDSSSTKIVLKKIRKAIKNATISSELLLNIEKQMAEQKDAKYWRFRSSTNAEDIDGFNGAGLYDSKTGAISDTTKPIEKAIKAVWASLWNDRAYAERQFFKINQDSVAMAILVHPAFGDEDMNAVAITKNSYREEMHGFVVNIQKGELPVVFSSNDITTEQLIIYDETEYQRANKIVEYLSYSSLNNKKPLLTDAQNQQLYNALYYIKNHYFYTLRNNKNKRYEAFAMDVEIKWKNGKMFIKQARIFND